MIETEDMVGTGVKISVAKDELVQALGVVSRAVSTRTSVQILSGILLEAAAAGGNAGELRLAATDMELSLRATIAAQVEGDGAIVLPGKTLVDIARLLPGDDVGVVHLVRVDVPAALEEIAHKRGLDFCFLHAAHPRSAALAGDAFCASHGLGSTLSGP